jgi:hypothetical protein
LRAALTGRRLGVAAACRPGKQPGLPPGGGDLESKAMPPPFQSSVVSMVSDLRDKTLHGLGKDTALISQAELAAQQAQVMQACEMLGDIANMVAKAEQGRSTRVVGDTLKETVVEQQRLVNSLKEQIATQQHYAFKVAAKCRQLETELETVKRRLKNEMKKSHELEVRNKELRIKALDAQIYAGQSREREGGGSAPSHTSGNGEPHAGEAPSTPGPSDEPGAQPASAHTPASQVPSACAAAVRCCDECLTLEFPRRCSRAHHKVRECAISTTALPPCALRRPGHGTLLNFRILSARVSVHTRFGFWCAITTLGAWSPAPMPV